MQNSNVLQPRDSRDSEILACFPSGFLCVSGSFRCGQTNVLSTDETDTCSNRLTQKRRRISSKPVRCWYLEYLLV